MTAEVIADLNLAELESGGKVPSVVGWGSCSASFSAVRSWRLELVIYLIFRKFKLKIAFPVNGDVQVFHAEYLEHAFLGTES